MDAWAFHPLGLGLDGLWLDGLGLRLDGLGLDGLSLELDGLRLGLDIRVRTKVRVRHIRIRG